MDNRIYPVPRKDLGGGQQLIERNYTVDPLLAQAIKEFAAHQSKVQGVKVSPGSVLRHDLLAYNRWIRDRYNELRKERGDAKRYIDPIKRLESRPSSRARRAASGPKAS